MYNPHKNIILDFVKYKHSCKRTCARLRTRAKTRDFIYFILEDADIYDGELYIHDIVR